MRLRLVAVGGRMPEWVAAGYREYARRLTATWRIELVELSLGGRGKGRPVQQALEAEAAAILKTVGADYMVALDVAGQSWSSAELAAELRRWRAQGVDCSVVIGGPDGLSDRCLERADARWSLSPLTLPHALVRIVVIEQLYRAWSLNAGHPYHR